MSTTPVSATGTIRPVRRVRHQARESLAVMAFSAGASGLLAGGLLLLTLLAR
ncbi:hypothetical protein K8W59_05785 [Nocardioides rotundus]|uniref:hypothetical protein n=1 Tax=Nocardioides rotundus TaxID=1774216 RepID=UPI001CBCD5E8|nr:hypothetical protein [Nocardioides rotundus]UAL31004.1 hypothetical protein K8W59_05785 [Nocardioides rotundus]